MKEVWKSDHQIRKWIGLKQKAPDLRSFAVIIKSSDICNYRCSYCYVEQHSSISIMPLDTAKVAIKKIVDYIGKKRKINFIWHGGEPLLAGNDFFAEVIKFSEQFSDNKMEHCIQTNGSLLTEKLLEFCKKHKIAVSLSFDGSESVHDLNRKDANGNGTHQKTMEALEKIRRIGLTPGCVCVLHKQNVERINELYDFFKQNRIHFRVNPVVRSGRAVRNYNDLAISPVEYGEAMRKLFDRWFNDDGMVQVEPLQTIVGNFVGPTIWGCDYHGNCLKSIVSINPDGGVYPCGRFAGLEKFKLGNIRKDSIESMFNSELFQKLSNRCIDNVIGCRECAFSEICNTGCMITAHMGSGNIYGQDYYCEGRRMLFSHIASTLKRHLYEASIKTQ